MWKKVKRWWPGHRYDSSGLRDLLAAAEADVAAAEKQPCTCEHPDYWGYRGEVTQSRCLKCGRHPPANKRADGHFAIEKTCGPLADVLEAIAWAERRGKQELTLLIEHGNCRVRCDNPGGGRMTVVDCEPENLTESLDSLWPAPSPPIQSEPAAPPESPVRYGPHDLRAPHDGSYNVCGLCGRWSEKGSLVKEDELCPENPLPEPVNPPLYRCPQCGVKRKRGDELHCQVCQPQNAKALGGVLYVGRGVKPCGESSKS